MSAAHVLVVEDDPTVREVVVRYLERDGLDVAAVGDGESALVQAGIRWPDLVVLDLMLPQLDGFEVCRRLRATAPLAVIMLTARGDEDVMVDATARRRGGPEPRRARGEAARRP